MIKERLGLSIHHNARPVFLATDRLDLRIEHNSVTEGFCDRGKISRGATHNGFPLRPVLDTEQTMIAEKSNKKLQGKSQHILKAGGPYRRTHGNQVMINKTF